MTVFTYLKSLAVVAIVLAAQSNAMPLAPKNDPKALGTAACSSGCVIESVCYNDPLAKINELELCNCKLLDQLKKCVEHPGKFSAQSASNYAAATAAEDTDCPEEQKGANAENVDDGSQDKDVPTDLSKAVNAQSVKDGFQEKDVATATSVDTTLPHPNANGVSGTVKSLDSKPAALAAESEDDVCSCKVEGVCYNNPIGKLKDIKEPCTLSDELKKCVKEGRYPGGKPSKSAIYGDKRISEDTTRIAKDATRVDKDTTNGKLVKEAIAQRSLQRRRL